MSDTDITSKNALYIAVAAKNYEAVEIILRNDSSVIDVPVRGQGRLLSTQQQKQETSRWYDCSGITAPNPASTAPHP